MVKERVEGISLTAQTQVVIGWSYFFCHNSMAEHSISLLYDHNIHHNILWKTDRSPELSCQGNKQVQNWDNIFWMHTFNAPAGGRHPCQSQNLLLKKG